MIVNKKIVWIPILVFVLSFVIEFWSGRVSFFSLELASWTFWVSVGIAALLVFLELFALIQNFVSERLWTPLRKANEYRERIKREREEIEELLDYEDDGRPIEEIKGHYYELEEAEFSKEALAPYLLAWFNHIDHVHNILQEEMHEAEIEHFQGRKEKLQKEIEELEQEKKRKLTSEEEQAKTKKEEFLEEVGDSLYVYADGLDEEQERWLAEEGFEKTHQWDIVQKESAEVMVKTRSNESLSHAYLVGALYKHLQDELGCDNVKVYETKLPDIVFYANGFEWAVEVETGSLYRKNQKELKEKVEMLKKKYSDRWFFVVTNKNLVGKYRTFGEAVDRSSVIDKIEEIVFPEGIPTDD